jgi:hypothetical protein
MKRRRRRYGHAGASEVVGEYRTRTGKIGARIVRWSIGGRVSYSWEGAWGAGSGDAATMMLQIASWKRHKRGLRVVKEFA